MIGDLRQGCKSDSDDESGGEALRNDLSPHGGSYPSTNRHSIESEAGDRSYLFAKGSHCDTFERVQTPRIRKESLNIPQGVHPSPLLHARTTLPLARARGPNSEVISLSLVAVVVHSTVIPNSCGLVTRGCCKCLLTLVSHSLSEQSSKRAGEPRVQRDGAKPESALVTGPCRGRRRG